MRTPKSAKSGDMGWHRSHLTEKHRDFLIVLSEANPDWSLLYCEHAKRLPGLRWKLLNMKKFQKNRPSEFAKQAEALRALLDR